MGWDATKGIDCESEDPMVIEFLEVAGISSQQMRNEGTRGFIYDFIGTHGGLMALEKELGQLKNPQSTSKTTSQPLPPSPLPPPPIPARTVPVTTSPGINNVSICPQ